MTNGLIAVSGVGRRVARRLADRGLPQQLIARDPRATTGPPSRTCAAHVRRNGQRA